MSSFIYPPFDLSTDELSPSPSFTYPSPPFPNYSLYFNLIIPPLYLFHFTPFNFTLFSRIPVLSLPLLIFESITHFSSGDTFFYERHTFRSMGVTWIFPLYDTIKKTTVQNPSRKPATHQKTK